MEKYKKMSIVIAFAITSLGFLSCDTPSLSAQNGQYTNPDWIPPQYTGVRYYYMPDIETYYDLTNRDFIYLDNGQWLFSRALPTMYSSYNLYDGFLVGLNLNVYQPWMHHQFYVSNYPRYYYRNRYQGNDFTNIRGFNENERKPFYWKQEDRNKTRKNEKYEERREPSRPPQKTNYYGRNIGEPVKVKPQMREKKQDIKPPNSRPNKRVDKN